MGSKVKRELLKTPRGTRDLLESELSVVRKIQKTAQEFSSYYGFQEIQTPHFEHAELFGASLGESTDVVEKQTYTFRTRGGDALVLRPEGTVPAVRAYFEHGLGSWPQPVMLYYSGSFFRHESPQKGRFREFNQFGLEILGEELAVAEATIIRVCSLIFKELGIETSLELNTLGDKECRPTWKKELVAFYRKHFEKLCKDCKRRFKENPLRLLDCKEPSCQEFKAKAPQMLEYVCEECKAHFKEVLEFMDSLELPYRLNPQLVRGFDYYTRTVFEFVTTGKTEAEGETGGPASPSASQGGKRGELGGGGRYDYLAQVLAGKDLAAAGAALGIDRIAELVSSRPEEKDRAQLLKTERPQVFLIQLGMAAKRKILSLMEDFRKARIPLAQSLSKDSLRGQLRLASKLGVEFSLIMGQKEALEGTIIIRNMDSGMQETLPVAKALERLKLKFK